MERVIGIEPTFAAWEAVDVALLEYSLRAATCRTRAGTATAKHAEVISAMLDGTNSAQPEKDEGPSSR